MKKMFNGLLTYAAFALILGGCAWAGNETNAGDNQTMAFHSEYGAKVRLLQLEAALDTNIAWGENIISSVKGKNASSDTADIEEILAELKALDQEVTATKPGTGDDAAKAFVDMKSDAGNLTKEFRESVHQLLNGSDLKDLKGGLKTIRQNETKDLIHEINQTRNEYNAQKLGEILTAANISDPGLVEKVRNGEVSAIELRKELKDEFSNLSAKDRRQALNAIKENTAKRNVLVRAAADMVAFNHLERVQTREEKRLDIVDKFNVSDAVRQMLVNRSMILEKRMNGIENRTLMRIDRLENITDMRIDRLDNRSDLVENISDRKINKLDDQRDNGNLSADQKNKIDDRINRVQNITGRIENRINSTEQRVIDRQDRMRQNLNRTVSGGRR